ncbi:hypothetical protein EGW08_021063, partial [Elysia chlorotica]
CDTSDGFQYVTSGIQSACILVTSNTMNYDVGKAYCLSLGAHLFVARTEEKLKLLPPSTRVTIGLTDIAMEGVFVWDDTGDTISPSFKMLFFKPTEPNNANNNEDCVSTTSKRSNANDVFCHVAFDIVCERPMIG